MHDLLLGYGFLLKVFDQACSHTGSVAGKQQPLMLLVQCPA
jgi:hypothetical protein